MCQKSRLVGWEHEVSCAVFTGFQLESPDQENKDPLIKDKLHSVQSMTCTAKC